MLNPLARSFRVVAEYTYDWESWIGPLGEPIWINPAVTRLSGYEVSECMAMEDYPLPMIYARDRRRMRNLFASALAGSSGNDIEFRIAHKSGELRWMAVSWQPMLDDRGQTLGYRTSIRDIQQRKTEETQLRRREARHRRREEEVRQRAEQLEQLVRERSDEVLRLEEQRSHMIKLAALGELAAAVAHEINNPLAGIKNAFRILRDHAPESQHELLSLVDSEIDRVSSIVRQMHQLYRYQPMPRSKFDMRHAIEGVCRLLEPDFAEHGVAWRWSAVCNVAVVLPEGDVKQVLYNLLRNAIEASPRGGTVQVSLEATDEQVRIVVRDEGAGIAPEVLPHIFEPFFSTKREATHSGLGLGLSVSRNLVNAFGGTLEAESAPGKGATFCAVFPRDSSGF